VSSFFEYLISKSIIEKCLPQEPGTSLARYLLVAALAVAIIVAVAII
jgi:hypothetical protein